MIVKLPPDVANRIAAGEVVERPASVVKELIENSIDAGASFVEIEVSGAGLQRIAVHDNGSGMDREDAALAFERHATSKIRSADDLFSISTLGFRGEALPSIASVARVKLVTSRGGSAPGVSVTVEGGHPTGVRSQGRPKGTSVEVRDLFYNTPARLKYLKSLETETRRIVAVAARTALARPDVRIRLTIDGRDVLVTPGTGVLRDVAACVLGMDIAAHMVDVAGESDGMRIRGLLAPARFGRSGRDHQHISVNGRSVSSAVVYKAIDHAYGPMLDRGHHAPVILAIYVDPKRVDVNVHPAKAEVRFESESSLFNLVYGPVSQALRGPEGIPEAEVRPCQYARAAEAEFSSAYRPNSTESVSDSRPGILFEQENGSGWRVVGQARNTYIIAESPEGLAIIDQHVAHERILVDRFMDEIRAHSVQIQHMLVPLTLDLGPEYAMAVLASGSGLRELGFEIEEFGPGSVIVRSVPAVGGDPESMLIAAAQALSSVPRECTKEETMLHIATRVACTGAVKAGTALDHSEMQALVDGLLKSQTPYTCPHGRPTMVSLGYDMLEKSVGRR